MTATWVGIRTAYNPSRASILASVTLLMADVAGMMLPKVAFTDTWFTYVVAGLFAIGAIAMVLRLLPARWCHPWVLHTRDEMTWLSSAAWAAQAFEVLGAGINPWSAWRLALISASFFLLSTGVWMLERRAMRETLAMEAMD